MNFYWRFFFKIINKSWYIYHVWAVKNSIWEGIVHPQWNDLCLIIKWETKTNRNQYIFSGNHEAENEHMHDYAGLESPLFRAQPMMSFYVHLNVVAALLLLSETSPASQVTKKTWSRISNMTEEKQASYFLCLEFSSCRPAVFYVQHHHRAGRLPGATASIMRYHTPALNAAPPFSFPFL